MTWPGRGDFSKEEWRQAKAAAHERHNGRDAEYLGGTLLLADDLEKAPVQLGYSLRILNWIGSDSLERSREIDLEQGVPS